jgi:hypothetical protein
MSRKLIIVLLAVVCLALVAIASAPATDVPQAKTGTEQVQANQPAASSQSEQSTQASKGGNVAADSSHLPQMGAKMSWAGGKSTK